MSVLPIVPVQRLRPGADLELPRYMTPGAAGLDLCADLDADLIVPPGDRKSTRLNSSHT